MENFMAEYLASIIAVLALLITALLLFFIAKGKYRKIAKQILLSLVVVAEKKFGSGTGEIKFACVVDTFYTRMPAIVQILLTEKDLSNMIEQAVSKMKEVLADNPEASRSIFGNEAH